MEEHDEATWASFEIPAQLPTVSKDSGSSIPGDRLHLSIATRTVITAARGGRLQRLHAGFEDADVEPPFAIPTLLPYWVTIEEWYHVVGCLEGWHVAASTLRILLAHNSRWLGVGQGTAAARPDRELTGQDVQSFYSSYSHDYIHEIVPLEGERHEDEFEHPLMRYLEWLAEDAEVAQRVADAWNAVVQRGQADDQGCSCDRCEDLD